MMLWWKPKPHYKASLVQGFLNVFLKHLALGSLVEVALGLG